MFFTNAHTTPIFVFKILSLEYVLKRYTFSIVLVRSHVPPKCLMIIEGERPANNEKKKDLKLSRMKQQLIHIHIHM